MSIITFLSDFGEKDWFVSAVKGEILKINPDVQIIDITHNVEPFNIKQAGFIIKMVYNNFPKGTIHLAVVDPGVGGVRKPIIALSDGHYFIGPDNGIFSYVYKNPVVYEITVRKVVSNTFHGRDIFGPVAARISLGAELNQLGKRIYRFTKFSFPAIKKKGNRIYGEVVYIDHFGNLITNIPVTFPLRNILVREEIIKITRSYIFAGDGEVIGVKGSSGFYEIACFKQGADRRLNIKVGDKIIGLL
jgi:S-adenosylmethionine hydrolase